jgi:RimJ/RimL family protein N-acetyltransferase
VKTSGCDNAVAIRPISPDEWPLFRELRLAALEEAPYAFETALADWQGANDTEQRWRRRLTGVPFNAIAYLDDAPGGMASGTEPSANGEVELISMWVAPGARGKGVGEALIAAVVRWARAQSAARVSLDVWEFNERAIALYKRCGFVDDGRNQQLGPPERRMVRGV